jgi:hypothetical protein
VRRSLNLHSCTNKDTPTHTYPSSLKSFLHACTLARWHASTPHATLSGFSLHATRHTPTGQPGGWRAVLKTRSVPYACSVMGAGFPVSAASGGGGLGRVCGTSILVESEAWAAGVCRSVSPIAPVIDSIERGRRLVLCVRCITSVALGACAHHRGNGRHTAGSFHSAQAVPFGGVAGMLSERYAQVTRTVLSTCFMSFVVMFGKGTGWMLLYFVTYAADFVSLLACLISSPCSISSPWCAVCFVTLWSVTKRKQTV